MAATKVLEASLGCPPCRNFYGKAWKKEIREGIWEHYTEPPTMMKYCPTCKGVIARMPA